MIRDVLVPMKLTVMAPDRFYLSYDGKNLEYTEEFDNLSQEASDRTITLLRAISPHADIQARENKLCIHLNDATPETMVSTLLGEVLLQALVRGLVTTDTMNKVLSEVMHSSLISSYPGR